MALLPELLAGPPLTLTLRPVSWSQSQFAEQAWGPRRQVCSWEAVRAGPRGVSGSPSSLVPAGVGAPAAGAELGLGPECPGPGLAPAQGGEWAAGLCREKEQGTRLPLEAVAGLRALSGHQPMSPPGASLAAGPLSLALPPHLPVGRSG